MTSKLFEGVKEGDKFLTRGNKTFTFTTKNYPHQDVRFPYRLIDPENPTFERCFTRDGKYYHQPGVTSVLDIVEKVL